jgi:hypothetical protein
MGGASHWRIRSLSRGVEAAVVGDVWSTGEAAVGRRWSRRLPTTKWRRGKHERWPKFNRGRARVKLTEAWRSTVVAISNAATTVVLRLSAVDRMSRG